MKQSLKTKLKQLWFPKAFRLPEPEFSKDQIDLLEELIQLIHPTLSKVETATRDERVHMAHFLVDLGTGIWRIRRKIEGLTRMPKEIRDALYSLESTWMSMSEGGVEIVDHIGTIPSKREATVVEVRDIPNLVREQVVDAVKPTILLRGEVIQLGEVVMGRPLKNGAAKPQPAPAKQTERIEPEEPAAPAAAPEPELREEEDVPPTETYQVETLSLEPEAEATEPTAEERPAAETSPEMPEPQEEPTIIEETPQAAAEEPAEPAVEAPLFDEDGEVVPQSAKPLFDEIEETEEAAAPTPTPEEIIETIESAQPAVAEAEDDSDSLDVPDVPPAPKARRKASAAKTGTKAKAPKKAADRGDEKDGEKAQPARKPARPKRKRPVKAAETEVEDDG